MRLLLLLLLLLVGPSLSAQVTPDSLLHRTTVGRQMLSQGDSLNEQTRRAQRQLDSLHRLPYTTFDSSRVGLYRQRQRDSLQQQVRHWQAKQDSLLSPLDTAQQKLNTVRQRTQTFQDSLKQHIPIPGGAEAIYSVAGEQLPDPLAIPSVGQRLPESTLPKLAPQRPDLPEPIHAVREHAADWQEKLSKYTSGLSEYQNKAAAYTTSLQQGGQVIEQQALQQLPEDQLLQRNQAALQDWKARQAFSKEQQQAQLQQRLLASAQNHFAHHSESLRKAQAQLVDLKRKYTLVQGTQKQKRSSLQGKPLGERLVYGGTMQILKGPPLAFDLSPQLAYRFNRRVTSGLGATYRLALSDDYRSVVTTDAVYGGRIFVEYEAIKSFLLHGEYERMSQVVPSTNQDVSSRSWQTSVLAGIGKTYRITGKLQGSVLLLYNFRHQQQSVHTRPWIVRFGFQRSSSR